MKTKDLLTAIIGGVIITLLTGFISSTPQMLVGAHWYGYPLPWLFRLVVAPEYFPWKVDPLNLIADIIVWAVIVGIILFIVKKARK